MDQCFLSETDAHHFRSLQPYKLSLMLVMAMIFLQTPTLAEPVWGCQVLPESYAFYRGSRYFHHYAVDGTTWGYQDEIKRAQYLVYTNLASCPETSSERGLSHESIIRLPYIPSTASSYVENLMIGRPSTSYLEVASISIEGSPEKESTSFFIINFSGSNVCSIGVSGV